MRLAGKVAVVTGAARGIGAAVAVRFAAEGAAVACVDVHPDVEATRTRIEKAGGRALVTVADVSTDEGNARAVQDAVDAFGGLDVFHANAAIQRAGMLEQTSADDWLDLYRTNLYGVASGLRHALPELRRRGGGSLILTASALAIVGEPQSAAYGAIKGAVRSLCRQVAVAHAPEGIRVNTICPADIDTEILADYLRRSNTDPDEFRRQIRERYPMRRMGTPDDVAGVALFLASDDSRFVTGTDLLVDGGLLALLP
jgi:NAD(P)-dependent dehydrogenase (short-subunit alcohol dehydrogenase family)